MNRRTLGAQGLEVSAEGFGCMGMTHAYGRGDGAISPEAVRGSRYNDEMMALPNN